MGGSLTGSSGAIAIKAHALPCSLFLVCRTIRNPWSSMSSKSHRGGHHLRGGSLETKADRECFKSEIEVIQSTNSSVSLSIFCFTFHVGYAGSLRVDHTAQKQSLLGR